jgi:hypothetical protein
MNKVKEELSYNSTSYCKVGKITFRKDVRNDSDDESYNSQSEFEEEASEKLDIQFIKK